jgi:hypothetical protein
VDRGKGGMKRSVAVDARGIPLGSVTAPANRHDSPLLPDTLERVGAGGFAGRGEGAPRPRLRLGAHPDAIAGAWLVAEISRKGRPAPLNATNRWVVERTSTDRLIKELILSIFDNRPAG